jgi:hypothetical protein
MNAEIEHASPYGKEPGEKVPGQRRVIGSAAMRAWLANRRSHGKKPPSGDEVKKVTERQPAAAAAMRAHDAPGRPQPVASRPAPAPAALRSSGGADWLLGITVTIAQFWMTLQALRKTRA